MVGWWCLRRLTIRVCSARFSWRSPPRSRQWRTTRPALAGIGGAPARRAKAASERRRPVRPGDGDLRGRDRPAARLGERRWGELLDQCRDLARERPLLEVELLDPASEQAQGEPCPALIERSTRPQCRAAPKLA